MKIIITGGTGFLGRHLVWRFASEGWDVFFTGRNQAAAQQVIALSPKSVTWIPLEHGSAAAQATLISLAQNADVIIHNAALSSPWGKPEEFAVANIVSTQEVIHACTIAQVPRLVHISTPSLYFNFSDRLGLRETDALPKPANEYARTKAEAELLVAKAQINHRVVIRPRAIFGPWDNTIVPRLLRVIERGAFPIMRGGKALLDLTYIDNVVEAIWLAATKPLVRDFSIYNVSNGEPQPVTSMLQQLADAFELPLKTRELPWPLVKWLATTLEAFAKITNGKEPLLTPYSAGLLAFSQTLDISAIRAELGYLPKISLQEGLQLHAEWWKSHKRSSM